MKPKPFSALNHLTVPCVTAVSSRYAGGAPRQRTGSPHACVERRPRPTVASRDGVVSPPAGVPGSAAPGVVVPCSPPDPFQRADLHGTRRRGRRLTQPPATAGTIDT